MKALIEKLENNFKAEEALMDRYKNTCSDKYWIDTAKSEEQVNELLWISKIQKRVLTMRHNLLENIQLETTKQLQFLSSKQRSLNLQNVA